VDDPTPDKDSDIERRALLDVPLALDDRAHNVIDRLTLGFGEESDMTEVHSEQRHVAVARALGTSKDGAVTTEDDDKLSAVGSLLVSGNHNPVGGLTTCKAIVVADPDVDIRVSERACHLGGEFVDIVSGVMGDQQH
jgi:hypothetical protein